MEAREINRHRSPNYPNVSLESAVTLVQRLYEKEKRASVALIVVAQALGGSEALKGLSGPARSKIAVLRAYGLIEDTGTNRVRVSDRALAILQKPTPAMYTQALAEAALAPPLFLELHDQHTDESDAALKYSLMRERDFTEDGANRAIKSYRETMDFAKLGSDSYIDNEAADLATKNNGTSIPLQAIQPAQARDHHDNSLDRVLHLSYRWPLPDGVDAQVTLLGTKPTARSISRLITYLEFMRDDLAAANAVQGDKAGMQPYLGSADE